MKTTRYLFITLLMTIWGMSVAAQQRNVLIVPDVTSQIGNIQLPVNIENTDEIVGAQFDLTLPAGVTAGTAGTMTGRSDDHIVTISRLSNGAYRVLLHSEHNRPLRGQQGIVMYLPITIPNSFVEGSEHQMTITNAVLGKNTGENVLTEVMAGKICISKLPDLTVKNIVLNKQTLNPSERVAASWQVENIGEMATGGGWSEQLSLVSEDGKLSKYITTAHYDGTLDAGGILSRQVEVTLPSLLGIDGQSRLQVKIVPDSNAGESASAQGNNTQLSNSLININKVLTLELSPRRIIENNGGRIALKVSRSGNWTAAETFSITATTDSRVPVPANITIPANQSGAVAYFNVTDNNMLDNDSIVNIKVTGNNYPEASARLIIEDNEYPSLTLTASKSQVTEGESFQLTITASRASASPIEVTLTSENSKRFSFPSKVTIPAGETLAQAIVQTVDDELPSLDLSNAFTVSASGYNKGEALVILKDNDLPVLELTLTPTTVSEGAGVVAVAGVLKRTTNTNSKITVKLSDDANGGLYFGNRTLELAKGVEEVHFNFGPVDNALKEGDRTYTITAAVWLSSCSCSASGESAGSVTAQLQVLDDDGAALNLTSSLSTVKEGGKTTLTVSRNTTNNTTPLTVTLQSDYDENLTYNHTVTIPAGQKSTTVEVTSNGNDVQGDNHTVIFTAQADGYATGTCYLMVTDQTLPDARISNITTDVAEAEVGTRATLNIVVTNDGAAELPAEVPVKIYRRGDSNAVGTIYTSEAMPVGSSQTLTKIITLPTSVGTHNYYAVVNESNKVQELTYTNNTSSDVTIATLAPFSATLSTDKSIYKQGEKVIITGQLSGNGTANASVELYVINEGVRQVQSVTTDAQGTFTYEWQLYALQSGHFAVGACYPGEDLIEEMASFDVYGLKRSSNDYITCETKLGEPFEGVIEIENPGQLPQTIKSFEVVSKPDACDVDLNAPSTIAANGRVQLKYKLTGSAVTERNDWEIITAKLTTEEGASLTLTLYYYCAAHHAVLTANTTSIKTTMTKGATREYLLNVMNTGKGSTGKISVHIPDVDWMRLGTSSEMPALEYGETATISLRFTPTEDMPLNLPYTGQIALNCENGNGTVVSYNIEAVSEATGILSIDVVDEYTYYTEEKPHVAGAGVVVKHLVTGAIVAQGETNTDGIYNVELPEGYYSISVSEGHHSSITGNVLIDPGTTNYQEVFLSYTAVSYSWNVTETEIEDEYKIETIVTFETNVPKPVVVVNLPTERPADGSIIAIQVTNKGLINAQNVVMNLDCTDGYGLELLNPDPVDVLAPQQMYTFYACFKKNPTAHNRRKAWGNPDADCISIFAGALYDYICGNAKNMEEALAQNKWGNCSGDGNGGTTSPWGITPNPHNGPDWLGGPGWPSGPGIVVGPPSTYTEPIWPETLRQWYCNLPCDKELTQALACEAGGRIIPEWLSCSYNLANKILHGTWIQRIGGLLDCAGLPNLFEGGCWDPYIRCMREYYNIHFSRTTGKRADSHNRGYETAANFDECNELLKEEAQAYRKIAEEIFGDAEWLECDNQDLAAILSYIDTNGKDYVFTSSDFTSYKPQNITDNQLEMFVDRINNTHQYESIGYDGITNYINPDTINFYSNTINQCEEDAKNRGWENVGDMYLAAYNDLQDYLSDGSNSVCASVSINISQTMVMTRQAFRGTLTVFNGNETTAMEDVKLNLEVVNKTTGEVATSHEFQINAESLEGFIGELDFGSGWTLTANSTGTAMILFIPTRYAAPTEPVEWSFGGTLSYIDPFTGLEVTRDLFPVTLTVKPTPELDLTYFMQRDVYGDDPLTEEVEPMVPAEFSLLINNIGYGDATNVKMVTNQPKIIDNEKGLLIDFEILSAQLNGGDKTLALGGSVASDFGTIPAHSQAYAQWWLTSSLLGHFTDYDMQATHVTSYDNPDLSLLNEVTIHELIRSIKVDEDRITGFVVNDLPDAEDTPDMVYFTDGTTEEVAVATNATWQKQSNVEYLMTITPLRAGWNYGHITDPTHGHANLVGIRRQSDGKEINPRNFWQTDRTLRDGKDWLYENNLHFVDQMANSTETYLLTFEPRPDIELQVASFGGVPEDGVVLHEPLQSVTVTFNKAIDASTFTHEDISLNCQGIRVETPIGITQVSDTKFELDLSEATTASGYYVLTVQTAGIKDFEGFNGASGKTATWVQFTNPMGDVNVDGKVDIADVVTVLNIMASDIYDAAADLNNDGKVDIADFVIILNIMAQPGVPHEYVDLGLPSGTLWATCNVGASSPEEYGDYFAWGETKPKDEYTFGTYMYSNSSGTTITKYCIESSYGTVDNKTELEPEDDAATMNWGSGWRMPTVKQLVELIDSRYTTATWTTEKGVYGCKITSKNNGKSIFLPAAGLRDDTELRDVGSYGGYWSRSLHAKHTDFAYSLYLRTNDIKRNSYYRAYGFTVRPVRKE